MNLFKLPVGELTVPRFSRAERVLHWLNAAFYIIMLVTGLSFSIPLFEKFSLGHPVIFLASHVLLGVILASSILVHSLCKKSRFPVSRWKEHLSYLKSNKYNVGQKLNITLTALFFTVFLFSGILLALANLLPQSMVKAAYMAHNLGVVLMVPLILGHMFLTLILPTTNRSLFAMLVGKVDVNYARQHHPEWFKTVSSTAVLKTDHSLDPQP